MAMPEFNCSRIFLLGGIIINTSPELNDMVDVRDFKIIEVNKTIKNTPFTSILDTEAFKNL